MDENAVGIKKDSIFVILLKFVTLIIAFVICWQLAVHTAVSTWNNFTDKAKNTVSICISEFGKTHLDKKLVVLTQDITVEISKEIDNRILWDWVSVGSANSSFKFIDNKVQYYVSLDDIKNDNIIFDPQTRTIKIIAPRVKLDKAMIVVQTDPNKVIKRENGSWSPFGPRLKDVSNEIMSEVRNVIAREGYHQLIRDKAQAEAQKVIEDFFNKALGELLKQESVNLQIIMP